MTTVGSRAIARLSMILVTGATLAATQPQAHAGIMDRILTEKTIKVGYIPAPPVAIRDPATGEVSGYYVDGLRAIFKAIGVKPIMVETTWATFIAGLQSGQFDLSIAGTFATIPRAAAVEFTKPINYVGYGAIVKQGDTRFKSLSDFDQAGIKIAVVQGGAGEAYVQENFPKATIVALSTGNVTAPFVEVSAGRADVGIEDASHALQYSKQQPGVTDLFRDHPYNVLPIAWSVKRGNEDLLRFMDTSIDYMLSTGRWGKLADKYGATYRFYDKPELAPFGSVVEK